MFAWARCDDVDVSIFGREPASGGYAQWPIL